MSRSLFHILFDGGERRAVYMKKKYIRLLYREHASVEDTKQLMMSSLDHSLPNYIVCGRGVTKANTLKHAHKLLEHHIGCVLDDDNTASLARSSTGKDVVYLEILDKLKEDDIEFIQWDASRGGFVNASSKEIRRKVYSVFHEKRKQRALLPPETSRRPVIPTWDEPILHTLLVNGGRRSTPPRAILPKTSSNDPFLADQRLKERHRQHQAWDCRVCLQV